MAAHRARSRGASWTHPHVADAATVKGIHSTTTSPIHSGASTPSRSSTKYASGTRSQLAIIAMQQTLYAVACLPMPKPYPMRRGHTRGMAAFASPEMLSRISKNERKFMDANG